MLVHSSTRVPSVRSFTFLALVGLACCLGSVSSLAADHYRWSVQYLLDQSQSVFGRPQTVSPRNNRGLAMSPDRKYLYAAYIWTITKKHDWTNKGELRKIDLNEPDYENATVALLPSPIAKALAVDDAGRVYAAMGAHISIYDADLAHELFIIPTSLCDGVAVTRSGSQLVLYSSERERHSLKRFEISESGGGIAGVKQTGFDGGTGEILIPDASSLRGVAVDTHGRIWLADVGSNQVFRVDSDGKDLKSLKLPAPLAIAFDGSKGYVTLSNDREVAIIDDEMNVAGAVAVPWKELELAPLGNNHEGILAAIVIDQGKGFWVANAHGQTADQRSTYGRVDQYSDVIKGKLYTDSFADDNDPILHAILTAPEADGAQTAVAQPTPATVGAQAASASGTVTPAKAVTTGETKRPKSTGLK